MAMKYSQRFLNSNIILVLRIDILYDKLKLKYLLNCWDNIRLLWKTSTSSSFENIKFHILIK